MKNNIQPTMGYVFTSELGNVAVVARHGTSFADLQRTAAAYFDSLGAGTNDKFEGPVQVLPLVLPKA